MMQEWLRERVPANRYEWSMLVGCMLLNRTKWFLAMPILDELLDRWPNPNALACADYDEVFELIDHLGMATERAYNLIAMSNAYFVGAYFDLTDLPGVGKYAADSHAIFVEGRTDVTPNDRELRDYLDARAAAT